MVFIGHDGVVELHAIWDMVVVFKILIGFKLTWMDSTI